MKRSPQRWELWRHVFGVCIAVAMSGLAIAVGLRIPVLADLTYGVHEFGHLMTWFLPEAYRAMMGSFFQVIVPVGLAGYFLLFQGDLLGVSLMLTWAGTSAHEAGLYIADAVVPTIELSPYHMQHDWSFALAELGKISAADELGWAVQAAGLAFVLIAVGIGCIGAVRAIFEFDKAAYAESFLERRPVEAEAWSPAPSPFQERMP